mgnify:CR=1 FL=1
MHTAICDDICKVVRVDTERCMKSELEMSLNQQSRCAASGWLVAMTCVRQHGIGDSKTYLPR